MTPLPLDQSLSEDWAAFLATPNDWEEPKAAITALDLTTEFKWLLDLVDGRIPLSTPVELVHGAMSHCLEVTNFDPDGTTATTVGEVAQRFGAVESIDTSERRSGKIFVKFFDLRSALAMHSSPSKFGKCQWMIRFAAEQQIGDRQHPQNNGTIVIFNGIPNISDEMIWVELSKCGDIREIRSSPYSSTKKGAAHKFIEFWDLRASQAAVNRIKRTGLFGAKVSADFSRPGGHWNRTEPLENRTPAVIRLSAKDKPALLLVSRCSSGIENEANSPVGGGNVL
jgi:hypothetical protein